VFVAQFIGTPPMNLLPAGMLGGEGVQVGVRAEHLQPTPGGRVQARVHQIEHLGDEVLVLTESEATGRLVSRMAPTAGVPMVGDTVQFDAPDALLHRFDATTGLRLP
jgi:ABC-type sugar transport system ATPase subunit